MHGNGFTDVYSACMYTCGVHAYILSTVPHMYLNMSQNK